MNQERKNPGKVTGESANKAQEKAKAREERNKAQAIEETIIWGKIQENSSKSLEIASRKPVIPYSDDLAIRICEELSNGVSLQKICARPDMPAQGTVYRMIAESPFFREIYVRARENAAHTLFDQMIDIADDCSKDVLKDGSANHAAIARAKIQIETRARVAGKLAPKVYAERLANEPAQVTVNNNTLNVSARDLSPDQRDSLRQLLLAAKHDDA